MDFLKEILGDDLYDQVKVKVDAFNGDESNAGKQIKIANLASGDYVSKGKYDSLQESLTGKDSELVNATKLIEDLKKASKGNEDMQGKIKAYEEDNLKLQQQLQDIKLKSAIKIALLSEKANDVDYLTFKLNEKIKEKGQNLELDENENIKGWDELISGLKTQFPTQFATSQGSGDKKFLDPNKLPGSEGHDALTKSDILKKPYAERAALYEKDPDAYNEAMKA